MTIITKTSDAIDELNGKLLDFDKFRTMEDSESSVVAIDEKLLDALSRYESILEDASNSSRELAENLKQTSGLFDENGVLDIEKWENIDVR